MKKFLLACLLAASAVTSSAATIYTSDRNVGAGTANISITTDDTIGVLSTSNIVAWTINVTVGPNSFVLDNTNSGLTVFGSSFSATATDLIYNFGDNFDYVLFQSPTPGSGGPFYCLQGFCFDGAGSGEGIAPIDAGIFERTALSGPTSIATAPEPATWSLMAAALGLLAVRRRKTQA